MDQTTEIEGAFRHLHIKFCKKVLRGSILYFCDDSEHATFDLEYSQDGSVHLWSFLLDNIPDGYVGGRIEKTSCQCITGLEITDDNILNFYIRKKLHHNSYLKSLEDTISDFLHQSTRVQEHFRYLTNG